MLFLSTFSFRQFFGRLQWYWELIADSIQNINGMYQRLWKVSSSLEEFGLKHLSFQQEMVTKYWRDSLYSELLTFYEPLKGYERHYLLKRDSIYSVEYPLTQIADMCFTESLEMKKIYFDMNYYLTVGSDSLKKKIMKVVDEQTAFCTPIRDDLVSLFLLIGTRLERNLKEEELLELKMLRKTNSQFQIGQIDRWIELLSK